MNLSDGTIGLKNSSALLVRIKYSSIFTIFTKTFRAIEVESIHKDVECNRTADAAATAAAHVSWRLLTSAGCRYPDVWYGDVC